MLLYCKFICSLSVERQIKALHQNQSGKHRNAHQRPLNSKYQSISPTFLSNLQVPSSTVVQSCQKMLHEMWEQSRGAVAESPSLTLVISACACDQHGPAFTEVSRWGLADITVLKPGLRAQKPYGPFENWAHHFFLLYRLFSSDLGTSQRPAGIFVANIMSADRSLQTALEFKVDEIYNIEGFLSRNFH